MLTTLGIWLEILVPARKIHVKHDSSRSRLYASSYEIPVFDVSQDIDPAAAPKMLVENQIDCDEGVDCRDIIRLLKLNHAVSVHA